MKGKDLKNGNGGNPWDDVPINEEHVIDKKCRAGICTALVTYIIDAEACTGCVACARACPTGAITGEKKEPHVLDQELCIKCGVCYEKCRFDAVRRS